jgi:hypothetical protein
MREDVRPATRRDIKRLRQEKPYERITRGRLMRVKDDNGNEYVQLRNDTFVGKALDVGRAQAVTVPPFARRAFSTAPLSPLDTYAASRLVAFGRATTEGRRIYPWSRKKVARGANQMAQGAGMLYSPLGYGSL